MMILGVPWADTLDHQAWHNAGVVYAEVVVSPPDVAAATAWSAEASIPIAFLVRTETTEDIRLLVESDNGQIVGAVAAQGEVAAVLRASCIPFELQAPVRQQIAFGASRIRDTLELFQDFRIDEEGTIAPGAEAAFVRDREIPLVHDPVADVAAGELDVLADHPYALLADMGYVQAFRELSDELNEVLELTDTQRADIFAAGLRAAFAPLPIRQELAALVPADPELESD